MQTAFFVASVHKFDRKFLLFLRIVGRNTRRNERAHFDLRTMGNVLEMTRASFDLTVVESGTENICDVSEISRATFSGTLNCESGRLPLQFCCYI